MTRTLPHPAPAPALSGPATFALVLLLWGAGLGAAGQFAKIAVPFPEIAALHPDAGGRVGWLLSSISLVGVFLGIVVGDLVGRIGAVRLLLAGLVLGGIVSLWQAGGPGFAAMMASRVAEGLSHLAIVVAAPVLMVRVAGARHAGAAMALWSTFFGVAFALTAWLGLPLVAARGPAGLFLAHGAGMLGLAAVLWAVLGRDDGARPGPGPPPASRPSLARAHVRAYRSPAIAAPGVGWLFYTPTFVALLAVLPDRLPEALRPALTGLLPLLGIAVSLVLGPVVLRRAGGVGAAGAGFALALGAVLLMPFGASSVVVAVGLFAAFGLVQAGSFAAVPELNADADDRALAYGVMAQTGNIGNLLGTPVLLGVLGVAGEAGMFAFVGALYALAIAAHLLLRRLRRGRPSSPSGGPRRTG